MGEVMGKLHCNKINEREEGINFNAKESEVANLHRYRNA